MPENGGKRIENKIHVFHVLILLSGVCISVNTILNTFFLKNKKKE